MKGTNIGEFEELVLLVVLAKGEEAYSVALAKEIEHVSQRKVVHSVVHAALTRLEKKGFVTSSMGEATEARGGRRKRIYTVTASGIGTLEKIKAQRDQLWRNVSAAQIRRAYDIG
ncbi:MAG: PadR family transcriptional regulator [Bacteroidota bacterium]